MSRLPITGTGSRHEVAPELLAARAWQWRGPRAYVDSEEHRRHLERCACLQRRARMRAFCRLCAIWLTGAALLMLIAVVW